MSAREPFVITGLDAVPDRLRGAAIAIGNFDGVHRGHQAVLAALRREAEARKCPAVVVTFEPPAEIFGSEYFGEAPFRLTPLSEKVRLLDALELDSVVVAPFEERFVGLYPEAYAGELTRVIAQSAIVVGEGFRFGGDRSGSAGQLARAGESLGFRLVTVPPLLGPSGIAHSSDRIRAVLAKGEIGAANADLGYRWFVSGEVVHGDKRGHALGFPTANIALPPSTGLRQGVYAVRVRRAGQILDGVASFGVRPTFGPGAPVLEVFLFDFAGDLYGETLEVSFLAWIRPEVRFDSVDALVARIREDESAARALLSAAGLGTELDQRLADPTNS